jgi:hypothetical protein
MSRWYNTTYVIYAASIILCYATKVSPRSEVSSLLDLGDKAVDILEAMDESVVARNAAKMVKSITSQARQKLQGGRNSDVHPDKTRPDTLPAGIDVSKVSDHQIFEDDLSNMDVNLDFFDLSFPFDSTQLPFWTDLENMSG